MCISHKHILVHLGCHSITKTKQGPFTNGEAACQNIGLGKVDHAEVSDKSPRRNIDKGEVDVTEAGVVLKCWRGKVDGRGPHQQRR